MNRRSIIIPWNIMIKRIYIFLLLQILLIYVWIYKLPYVNVSQKKASICRDILLQENQQAEMQQVKLQPDLFIDTKATVFYGKKQGRKYLQRAELPTYPSAWWSCSATAHFTPQKPVVWAYTVYGLVLHSGPCDPWLVEDIYIYIYWIHSRDRYSQPRPPPDNWKGRKSANSSQEKSTKMSRQGSSFPDLGRNFTVFVHFIRQLLYKYVSTRLRCVYTVGCTQLYFTLCHMMNIWGAGQREITCRDIHCLRPLCTVSLILFFYTLHASM